MRIIVAPQGFKGTLSGHEAASAMAQGIARVLPDAEVVLRPVADGGHGTLDTLLEAAGGATFTAQVMGPMGRRVDARWGVLGDGSTAVVEMAQASGLTLVPPAERAPMQATTYGTGQLIKTALAAGLSAPGGGCRRQRHQRWRRWRHAGVGHPAPGHRGPRYLLRRGRPAQSCPPRYDVVGPPGPQQPDPGGHGCLQPPVRPPRRCHGLRAPEGRPPRAASADGCGALTARRCGGARARRQCAGRARRRRSRRSGRGLVAFLGAELAWGIELVCDAMGFDATLQGADLVLTGEGRLDGQTVSQKAPIGVVRRAKAQQLPVIAVAGSFGPGHQEVLTQGIDLVEAASPEGAPAPESVAEASALLADATERALHRAQGMDLLRDIR